jgi:dTDP-4-amino-4,6-dideoxygalactose transaminase
MKDAETPIPFLDLARDTRPLKNELLEAFAEVVDSGVFLFGPKTEALEAELARRTGARYAIAVGSGTIAIEVLLRACGIGPGDEVITTPASFYSSAKAIASAGATAVFADVDPDSYNLDPACAAARITSRTKALLVVHLYGRPAPVKAFRALADRAGILFLEDAAQAIDASVDGQPVGGWGHGAALSFYPTKNIGALGDAGAVLTSDSAVARRAESLRFLGTTGRRDEFSPEGLLARVDELQAALLLVKLRHAESALRRRHALASRYTHALPAAYVRPQCPPSTVDANHLYVIRTQHRDRLAEMLRSEAIGTQIHYRVPLHRQPLFCRDGVTLPVAERWCREVLSLPLSPALSDGEQTRIIDVVNKAHGQLGE